MQQQQIPQDTNWQARLEERLTSQDWKKDDSILASLTPEEITTFALQQIQSDRPGYFLYFAWQWVLGPLIFFVVLYLVLLLGYFLKFSELQLAKFFTSAIIFFPGWIFLLNYFAPRGVLHPWRRYARLRALLPKILPLCTSADILPTLVANRGRYASKSIDAALVRTLTPLSGEAVFALPFALRAELAQLAEKTRPLDSPQIPENLSIVILLALTSARDGNVQPVLRRMSKDGSTPRLREVAAECLREFSADDAP